MNPDSLVKILTFFNKPFHYLIAGIIILVFAEKDWAIWGWLLIGLSIASFVEWLVNIGVRKYNEEQKKNREQQKENIKKEKIYQAYNNLKWSEKIIVFCCVNRKNIVYKDEWGYDAEEILALSVKDFGQLKDNNTFILHPQYLEILKEYPQIKEDYETYKNSKD